MNMNENINNEQQRDYLEASYSFTLNDCFNIISEYGFNSFVTDLFEIKKNRNLTIEEREAMDKLHEGWNL